MEQAFQNMNYILPLIALMLLACVSGSDLIHADSDFENTKGEEAGSSNSIKVLDLIAPSIHP